MINPFFQEKKLNYYNEQKKTKNKMANAVQFHYVHNNYKKVQDI